MAAFVSFYDSQQLTLQYILAYLESLEPILYTESPSLKLVTPSPSLTMIPEKSVPSTFISW